MKNCLTSKIQKAKIFGNKIGFNYNVLLTGVQPYYVQILFLVHTNNDNKSKNFRGRVVCYADDTALIFAETLWKEKQRQLI